MILIVYMNYWKKNNLYILCVLNLIHCLIIKFRCFCYLNLIHFLIIKFRCFYHLNLIHHFSYKQHLYHNLLILIQ